METIGLALAILPAFSVCLEYFQLYKTAKATDRESRILMFKFDCEHENFIIWGERHGVLKPRGADGRNPDLDDHRKGERISTALNLIRDLLSDAVKLKERYGVIASVGVGELEGPDQTQHPTTYPSSSGLRRLQWLGGRGKEPGEQSLGLVEKTRWAIHDRTKFQQLIDHIRDLVERLYTILPIPAQDRNNLAIRDLKVLARHMTELRLYEEASMSAYPVWSGAASVMIEAGSTHNVSRIDNVSQWMDGFEGTSDSEHGSERQGDGTGGDDPLKINMPAWYRKGFYFAFTPNCPTSGLGLSCDMDRLEIQNDGPSHLFKNDNAKVWGLSKRLRKLIVPNRDKYDLEKIAEASHDVQGELLESYMEERKRTCIIFCPPCRCAIRDALIISMMSDELVDYTIRIDDRIPASCCQETDKIRRLRTLVQTLSAFDEGQMTEPREHMTKIGCAPLLARVDRAYIEQRVYQLEIKFYGNERYMPIRPQITELLNETATADVTRVFLGEARTCSWIIQTPPFTWSPRVPKEKELFLLTCLYGAKTFTSEYLGSFTCAISTAAEPAPVLHTSKPRSGRKGTPSLTGSAEVQHILSETRARIHTGSNVGDGLADEQSSSPGADHSDDDDEATLNIAKRPRLS